MIRKLNLIKISRILAIAFVVAILLSIIIGNIPASAATRDLYWVGGSGGWEEAAHWSLASGGAGGEAEPDSDDNVYFDSASDSGASFNVSLDSGDNYCYNFDASDIDQTMNLRAPGGATAEKLYIYGSFVGDSNLILYDASSLGNYIYFASTGVETVTWDGTTDYGDSSDNKWNIWFNGGGGSWTFQDGATLDSSNIKCQYGTVDFNGQTITCRNFDFGLDGNTHTITLGAATINCITIDSGTNLTGFTFNGSSSTFNVSSTPVELAGQTYGTVNLVTSSSLATLSGENTITTLTIVPTYAGNCTVSLSDNQTVSGTVTFTGNSAANRLLVNSSSAGVQRDISAATLGVSSNVDFKDIDADGASAPWDVSAITGSSADLGNNTDITFAHKAYWVGGSGYWNGEAEWSGTSGGATNANWTTMLLTTSVSPYVDVYFDANSFTGSDQYVKKTGLPLLYCHDMDWTGALYNPHFVGNWEGSTRVYGSITFIENMQIDKYTGWANSITMCPDATSETLTMNGNTSSEWKLYIKGVNGGTVTFQDDIISSNDIVLEVQSGNLDFNGITFSQSGGSFVIDTSDPAAVDISNSTIILAGGSWEMTDLSDLTSFDATGSTITAGSTFSGGGLTYNVVNMTGAGKTLSGNNTITTLTSTGSSLTVSGANTVTTATFTGGGVTISGACSFATLNITGTAVLNDTVNLGANQTVTTTLNIDGNSAINRLLVKSNTLGTARTLTLTGATVSGCTNVDFLDITATPAIDLSSITGGSGNLGGNTGITFTTATSRYWVEDTGNWSNTNHWSATSGGAGGASMPLAQDTAIFNSESFSIATRTVTVDVPYVGTINSSAVVNAPTIYSATTINVYGSLYMGANYWTGTTGTYFYGRDAPTVDTQGYSLTGNVYTYPYGTTLTLASDLVLTGTLYHRAGTLDFVAYDVSAAYFDSSTTTYTRTLTLGSGMVYLSGTAAATKWNVNATNLTLSSNTALIVLSNSGANAQTFTGGTGITTYYGLMITGAGNYTTTFSSANTFAYIWIDRGDAAKTIAGNVTLTTSALSIPVNGTTVVTITNTDFSKASGTVVSDYLTISGSTAAGGATFYAGANGVDSGGNAGWIFTDAPTPIISTLGVEDMTDNSVTLNGNIDTLDGETTGYVYFQYGTTDSYGSTTTQTGKSSVGLFNAGVTGLSSGTVYHYRAVFRYDGTSYVYGNDLTFTTTSTPGAPIIVTGSASSVDTNSATLNGGVASMGIHTAIFVSFEYGTDTTYGNATGEEFVNSTTGFNADITGLTPGMTYHFRARARYVIGSTSYYATGGDVTFTTVLASGASTIITIRDGGTAVFNGYFETGDMLLTAEIINTYTGYYPDKNPEDYFQVQLLNAAGTAILGATPLWAWGDIPVSILFAPYQVNGGILTNGTGTASGSPITLSGATTVTITGAGTFTIILPPGDGGTAVSGTATVTGSPVTLVAGSNTITAEGAGTIVVTPTNLVLESAYILRVQGIGELSDLAPTDYTLTPFDWKGTDLAKLDSWMKGTAFNINTYNDWWGTTNSMLSNVTDVGTILSDNGGAFFSQAIPDITTIRPDMFTTSKSQIIVTTGTANNVFDGQTWQSGQAYVIGDKVGYDSLVYECIANGTTTLPDTPESDAVIWALSVGETVWQAQVGADIASDATTFGSLFGISGQIYLGYLILIVILGIALFGVSRGAGALGMILMCIPLLLAGNFFRVVGIQITIIVSVAAIFLWVRQYWIKST